MAAALGLSEENVRVMRHRGVERLRDVPFDPAVGEYTFHHSPNPPRYGG